MKLIPCKTVFSGAIVAKRGNKLVVCRSNKTKIYGVYYAPHNEDTVVITMDGLRKVITKVFPECIAVYGVARLPKGE